MCRILDPFLVLGIYCLCLVLANLKQIFSGISELKGKLQWPIYISHHMHILKNILNTSTFRNPQMFLKDHHKWLASCLQSVAYLTGDLLIVLALQIKLLLCTHKTHTKTNAGKRVRENRICWLQKQGSYRGREDSCKLFLFCFTWTHL